MTNSPDDTRIPTLTRLIKPGSGKSQPDDGADPADAASPPEVTPEPARPDTPEAVGPEDPVSDDETSLVDKAMSRIRPEGPPDDASPPMPTELDIDLQPDELEDLPFHSLEEEPVTEPVMGVDPPDEELRMRVETLVEQILAERLPELRTKLVEEVMASLRDTHPSSADDTGKD